MKKTYKISLNDLEVYSYHGYYPEERVIGGWYNVSVIVEYDFSEAGKSDDLSNTLNYEILYNLVINEMSIKSMLLENVAQRIIDNIAAISDKIKMLSVKLEKKNPPFPSKINSSAVEIIYSE